MIRDVSRVMNMQPPDSEGARNEPSQNDLRENNVLDHSCVNRKPSNVL